MWTEWLQWLSHRLGEFGTWLFGGCPARKIKDNGKGMLSVEMNMQRRLIRRQKKALRLMKVRMMLLRNFYIWRLRAGERRHSEICLALLKGVAERTILLNEQWTPL